ncbi:MAG: putative porin [Bacteroidaceae bacterium]|nr:putative porin [Bacteroidaceae bacterium]
MKRLITLLLTYGMCVAALGQAHFKTNSDYGGGGYGNPSEYGGQDGGNYYDGRNDGKTWGRDTTRNSGHKEIPIGVHQWIIEPRLGTIVPAENNDTAVHMFQYYNCTEGRNGEYNILGNLGSPRLSRIYLHREQEGQFVFLQPYDFFLGGLQDFRFSNTLSPLTNLAYHKVGNRVNGQERVRAYFASNINKVSGIGFKLDYLYGRGYYNAQANAAFGGTLFGYYLGDRYNLHAWVNANHGKMSENGGVEDDLYITDPQSFPQRFSSKDIPTNLTDTWNRNDNETYYLTHRYNLGAYYEIEVPDSLKPQCPSDADLLMQLKDSLRRVLATDTLQRMQKLDSLRTAWVASLVTPKEFVPVSSIIHTMEVNTLRHTYYSNNTPSNYYSQQFYGDLRNVRDKTKAYSIRNTFGLAMREGFNKWAAMGITLFGTHELRSFTLPELGDSLFDRRYNENNLSVGGEIARTMGSIVHYNVHGDITLLGEDVGQFRVDGKMDVNIPLGKRDTMQIEAHGFVKNLNPSFYYRHYHSQFHWWDNDLSKEFKTRIEGSLSIPHTGTSVHVGVENVKNYTHFAMANAYIGSGKSPALPADYSHAVVVRQQSGSVQVFSAALQQNLAVKAFHWDNEITYQATSDADVLPLPKLSVYSNLYLGFRIAKVLNVELGADCRYFTAYYAPDYAPAIGQFATQDASFDRIKIGNYPVFNAYVNLHIKHCRIYLAMHHLNAGMGASFWAPHYAMDPRTFHFGVSWNFFN